MSVYVYISHVTFRCIIMIFGFKLCETFVMVFRIRTCVP